MFSNKPKPPRPDQKRELDIALGESYEGYERTIDVHIRNLRIKIEPDPSNPHYIETVYGTGYRFAAQD